MSKLQRLRDNIEALQHAMSSTSEYDSEILNKYSGFGGLTFVLNPLEPTAWTKNDMMYYQDTVKLHELLREEAGSDKEYQAWVESLKASTLTAYYTPGELIARIVDAPNAVGFKTRVVLDPAAGSHGAFAQYALSSCNMWGNMKGVLYEKDLLSGFSHELCLTTEI